MPTEQEPWWEKHIHHLEKYVSDDMRGEFPSGWYFSDETGSLHGPYETRQEAVDGIRGYVQELSGDPSDAAP